MLKLTLNKKLALATLLALTGLGFFFIRADRQFIDLAPSDPFIVLTSNSIVEQTFLTSEPNLSRVNLYFKPTIRTLPVEDITISIKSDEQTLGTSFASTSFIDGEGFTNFNFDPALNTRAVDQLTLTIHVPPTLDGALKLRQRDFDGSFDPSTYQLTVNGQAQDDPIAYHVYTKTTPPLAIQLGGLLLLAPLLLYVPHLAIYIITVAALYVIPAALLTKDPNLLIPFIYSAGALAGMYTLLRSYKIDLIPALAGAHLFAFTTWLPLHWTAGRELYAALYILPLLVLAFRRPPHHSAKRILLTILLLIVAILSIASWQLPSQPVNLPPAQARDIFLDPVQNPLADKVSNISWSHYGAYIGVITSLLTLIGIAWQGWPHKGYLLTGILALTIILSAPSLIIPSPHFSILVIFSASYFAAWGMQALKNIISRSRHDRVATTVIAAITLLALLDLWQVAAHIFGFALGYD